MLEYEDYLLAERRKSVAKADEALQAAANSTGYDPAYRAGHAAEASAHLAKVKCVTDQLLMLYTKSHVATRIKQEYDEQNRNPQDAPAPASLQDAPAS